LVEEVVTPSRGQILQGNNICPGFGDDRSNPLGIDPTIPALALPDVIGHDADAGHATLPGWILAGAVGVVWIFMAFWSRV